MEITIGKTKIFHLRNRYGPCPGETLPCGGITVAVSEVAGLPVSGLPEDTVYAAIGVCGHRHSFSRKLGCSVSIGRLEARMTGELKKFSGRFPASRFGGDSEFDRALSLAHILIVESRLKGRQRRTAMDTITSTREYARFMEENGKPGWHNPRFDPAFLRFGTVTGRIDCSKENGKRG